VANYPQELKKLSFHREGIGQNRGIFRPCSHFGASAPGHPASAAG